MQVKQKNPKTYKVMLPLNNIRRFHPAGTVVRKTLQTETGPGTTDNPGSKCFTLLR